MMASIFCLALLMLLAEASQVDKAFSYIEDHQSTYVQRLKDWVHTESDSSNPDKRQLVIKMMNVAKKLIEEIGGSVEMAELGDQLFPNGQIIPLPPAILATFGSDPKKPTVCFYGHLDVQPARKDDGWATEPYTLVEKNGNFYGRGADDDKGHVLAFLNAVEAVQVNGRPVNVKMFIEGMEEVGSNGLDDLIKQKRDTFFGNVDFYVIADTPWVSKVPGITYGARGDCYFFVEVKGPQHDLHSGVYGGTVYEPMSDLIYLLESLEDCLGHINITGIYDAVAPLTEEEKKLYAKTTFNIENYKAEVGTSKLLHDTKEEVLMYRWRWPSLSIHGIEGAFSGSGSKTVIPSKIIGKFSIRIVPNMEPSVVEKQDSGTEGPYTSLPVAVLERDDPFKDKELGRDGTPRVTWHQSVPLNPGSRKSPACGDTGGAGESTGERESEWCTAELGEDRRSRGSSDRGSGETDHEQKPGGQRPLSSSSHALGRAWLGQVTEYLMKIFAERNSPNKLNVTMVIGAKPWISSLKEPQYLAAQKAVRKAYGVEADMIRTGGTVPITRTFQDVTGKHVMILGIGGDDDALHGQNEKISRYNYIGGTKLYSAFLHELSKV